MRIIHGRRRPGLTNETLPERLIGRQCRREDLQRYLPLKPLILGPEHNRHPALADLLLQTVTGHLRTNGETRKKTSSGHLSAHQASRTRKLSSSAAASRPDRNGEAGPACHVRTALS